MPCGLCGDIIPTVSVRCPACGAWSHRRDFRALAIGLFTLLGFNAFLALGSAVSMLRLLAGLNDQTVFGYDEASAGPVLAAYGDVFLISAVLAVVTGVLFIAWLWQAHAQAPGPLRHRRVWTVGSWFVPVANLWMPPRIVHDVWVSTGRYRMARRHGVLLVVTAWWGSLLGGAALARTFPGMGANTLADARFAVETGVAAAAGLALAATLCMAVVFQVTRLQLSTVLD
ncbi:DUF4328 domain-containing protein [Actinocorallia populi]|uniref:DUF4328 domain-containing protein n=1 Tax=Actinocorallia populi TaxID=2079200 RepID=UPI000D094CCF|nr:DUF4328 domain-containing protein [Actinocorallia populi]